MLRYIICRDKGAFHFNSKGAFGLRFCRKSKFNARGAYRFGYDYNVRSDSSIGKRARVLVFKTVNRQSVIRKRRLVRRIFLLSSSDCRRRRVLADK